MAETRELLLERARMQKFIDLFAIASQEIGSSLDYSETQRRSVRLATSMLAETVVLISIDVEGELRVASGSLGNEELETTLERWQVREAIRTGEPFYVRSNRSSLSVPIRERGEVTGVLCFETKNPEGFETSDRHLMNEFVERIGIAMANARLYESLRAVEKELVEAKKRAEDESRAKSTFLATMSHEIRTPLTAILGFSELLSLPQAELGDREEFATRIRANGEHLMRLIDEILNFAKIEAGKVEVEIREIDLPLLLSNLEAVSKTQAGRKDLAFDVSLLSAIPASVESDPTRLNQIMNNLVSNAIKFTSKGRVEVAVEYKRSAKCLIFTVRDTGPGLTAKQAEKLFMPFSQADVSHTRMYGGTGIGLALSRKLAQLLGGDVELVETKEGVGTTFRVGLPVKVSDDVVMTSSLQPSRKSVATERRTISLQGKCVLVVDDSEDNRNLVSRYLKSAQASVRTASNGIEAIEAAEGAEYDVVLMDVQMPGMDGLTATRELRKRGYSRPIISLTAHVLEEERRECLLAGCNGHLTKPVQKTELIAAIAKWSLAPLVESPVYPA